LGNIICTDLEDTDLPLVGFEGNYNRISITRCPNLTTIPANSFEGILPREVLIDYNPNLISIQGNFVGNGAREVKRLTIPYCNNLE
jgi:hypothetical protein